MSGFNYAASSNDINHEQTLYQPVWLQGTSAAESIDKARRASIAIFMVITTGFQLTSYDDDCPVREGRPVTTITIKWSTVIWSLSFIQQKKPLEEESVNSKRRNW